MHQISDLLKRLAGNERSKLMARKMPDDLARLHIGDPFFQTPEHICLAALDAMREGYTNYAPFPGDLELREAICRFLKSDFGAHFHSAEILVTQGASEAIFCAIMGYINPGDEVLMFDPTYSLYSSCVMSAGGVSVPVPLSDDFKVAPEELKRRVTPSTRMIIINNPNNPTGAVYSQQELKAVAQVALDNDIIILSDEVYHEFVYQGFEHFSLSAVPEIKDNCLLVNSFSKTYAMTGWRVGYLAGPEKLIEPLLPLHCTVTGTVNHPAQRACLAALTGPQDCVDEMRAEYSSRREEMIRGVDAIEGLSYTDPQGAFYLFCKFDLLMTSRQLTDKLIDRGVAVRSGSEYGPGGEGYIRLAYTALVEEIEEGMARLKKAFRELRG